jgi:Protein of unknown function (DUF3168)
MSGGLLDAKAIIRGYLLEQPAIQALEARVVGKTPDTTAKPWVRITLIDPRNATGINRVEHLVSYYLQFDCYAGAHGGEPEAFELAKAVRAALVEDFPNSILEEAVVTDVEAVSMHPLPDTDLDDARARFILDVEIYMHPY